MLSAWVTDERSPSNPKLVLGSPPHTIGVQRCTPVQPERVKRAIGRRWRSAKRWPERW